MKNSVPFVLIAGLWATGCTAVPAPTPPPPAPWPASVADVCPRRSVLPECFRRDSTRAAMQGLSARFRACHPMSAEPLKVMLTIETRGGAPFCVERAPRDDEAARCVAKVVARHLVIPNSPDDERCHLRYPILFEPGSKAEPTRAQ